MNNPENRPLLVNGTETPSAGELHDMLMEYSESGFMYPLCAELKYVAKFLLEQQAKIEGLDMVIWKLQTTITNRELRTYDGKLE
jgi:hypothetical protein